MAPSPRLLRYPHHICVGSVTCRMEPREGVLATEFTDDTERKEQISLSFSLTVFSVCSVAHLFFDRSSLRENVWGYLSLGSHRGIDFEIGSSVRSQRRLRTETSDSWSR